MGIELICDVCQAPMCCFSNRRDGSRICSCCRALERQAQVRAAEIERVFAALGALTAGSRGYVPRGLIRYVDSGNASVLVVKVKALIKHDRILLGSCLSK